MVHLDKERPDIVVNESGAEGVDEVSEEDENYADVVLGGRHDGLAFEEAECVVTSERGAETMRQGDNTEAEVLVEDSDLIIPCVKEGGDRAKFIEETQQDSLLKLLRELAD